MITEEKCYVGTCDNCGEIFNDGEFSLFPLESDVKDSMMDCEWYSEGTDPEHEGKHYCPDCFKYYEEVDDKIIVDISRKKSEGLAIDATAKENKYPNGSTLP